MVRRHSRSEGAEGRFESCLIQLFECFFDVRFQNPRYYPVKLIILFQLPSDFVGTKEGVGQRTIFC